MTTLDDAAVVSLFAQGGKTLAANQHLRIEPAFDSVQLLSKRGGLIATIKYSETPPKALVREQSEFWGLVNHVLLEHCFMPLGTESGFYQYQKCDIPAGYKMNMAEAKVLWREWWRQNRHAPARGIQMDLLVFVRNTWYPIRQITPSQEMLFVSTLTSELQLDGSDLIVWLSRSPDAASPQAGTPQTNLASAQTSPQTPAARLAASINKAQARSPIAQTLENSAASGEATPVNPHLKYVLREVNGKLHIKTAIGEIIVEGTNLQYQLIPTSRPGAA